MYSVEDILNKLLNITNLKADNNGEYKLLCPFHKENTPSFRMRSDGKFICFGCEIRGHSLTNFIAQYYGVHEYDPEDDNNALVILAAGDYKKLDTVEYQRTPISTEQSEKNLQAAKDYYNGSFHGDALANKDYTSLTSGYVYMYSRGLMAKTLKHFHVIDWQTFTHHPIFIPLTFNGSCWGYQQRRIKRSSFPKYLSMSGQDTAQHVDGYADESARIALVVEGTFDKMFAWQYGWWGEDGHACFVIVGSHVSEKQAEIMAQYNVVYLSGFDNDAAGEKAHQSFVAAMAPYNKEIIRMCVEAQGISKSTETEFWHAVKQALKKKKQFSTSLQNSSEICYKNDMS